ncbi:MAG TPA: NADH-quinone oxidoreductase subunit NuoE [Terricaulis sp.]|nr:NADH-quinone oxidoreductase subunit NuoE [Terricaulis sp.]HRP12144.1 NADH-quinone oxidoreductase subunit NuoE [Terricaulis sp.]
MSVRRLALEQPDSFAFSLETMESARWWMQKYPPERKASAVIPILWLVQKQEGWVSEPAIQAIADLLAMPKIRVLEVATFYTMFHLAPVGKHHFQLCGTTPCVLRGAEELKEVCKRRIGHKHAVSADGMFSWEEVECVGACVNAPVVAIDDYYHEDLTPETLEARIDALARGEKIEPGSAIQRQTSAPEGGTSVLSDPALYDGSLAQKITLPNLPEKA